MKMIMNLHIKFKLLLDHKWCQIWTKRCFLSTFHSKIISKSKYVVSLSSLICELVGFFFVVNNDATIICCNPQIMKCVVCHYVEMDVDAHILSMLEIIKGLYRRYNKKINTSSLGKTCF